MHELWQPFSDVLSAVASLLMPLIFCGTLIVIWLAQKSIDRTRIESNLAVHGWRLLKLERQTAFFVQSGGPHRYLVTYRTPAGAIVQAECFLSWLRGVQWISSTPFDA